MQRQPLMHERVFDDPEFARMYAKKHETMGRRLGKSVVGRDLVARGFEGGGFSITAAGPVSC